MLCCWKNILVKNTQINIKYFTCLTSLWAPPSCLWLEYVGADQAMAILGLRRNCVLYLDLVVSFLSPTSSQHGSSLTASLQGVTALPTGTFTGAHRQSQQTTGETDLTSDATILPLPPGKNIS